MSERKRNMGPNTPPRRQHRKAVAEMPPTIDLNALSYDAVVAVMNALNPDQQGLKDFACEADSQGFSDASEVVARRSTDGMLTIISGSRFLNSILKFLHLRTGGMPLLPKPPRVNSLNGQSRSVGLLSYLTAWVVVVQRTSTERRTGWS